MKRRVLASLCLAAATAACAPLPPAATPAGVPPAAAPPPLPPATAARNFVEVIRRVEPVAEYECRQRAPGRNCDFQILVDDRVTQPPNAFQTLDATGRPVIVFTLALIAEARNSDELAFVLGHEAAHHVAGHLARTQTTAMTGALILGTLAAAGGAGSDGIRMAQDIGATVGARTYSKDYELEADSLGTVIAYRAGYDPLRGAAFFDRLPDPGNRFLGTHPPNAARRDAVAATLRGLR